MHVRSRLALCLALMTVWGSSLVAQTFTFGQPKPVTVTSYTGIAQVQTADINGDGKSDVIIPTANAVYAAYLGDGTGGFSTTPLTLNSLDLGAINPIPKFMDVNGDGIADQVFAFGTYSDYGSGYLTTVGEFVVALGDGKGHYTITTSLGSLPESNGRSTDPLAAADFNGDGKIDFALLTQGGTDASGMGAPAEITVFLNQGNGKFAQQRSIPLEGSGVWLIVAGDFNGDGRQDLAWTVKYQGVPIPTPYQIHYMYGNGDGTFGTTHIYTTDTQTVSLASGDLNGDHKTDLVVGLSPALDSTGHFVSGSTWRIATLLAKQKGGFYWASAVSSTTATTGLELMDLNNDGHLDAIYDWAYLRAGLSGGGFGPHQIVTGQTVDPNAWWFVNLPFSPLVKGGLPAVFSQTVDSSGSAHINVQLNTSK